MSSLLYGAVAAGATLVVAVFLGAILLLAIAIFIVGVSNRSDADERGSRAIAAYSFSAAFLFLWVVVLAVVAALDALIDLIGNANAPATLGSGLGFGTAVSPDHAAARACVLGALALLFAGGAYVLHVHRGNALADEEVDPGGPTKRVLRSFVALVCFVAILLFVASFVVAAYDVFILISPTVFGGSTSRTVDTRSLLHWLVLVVASGWVFAYHQRFAPEGLRLLGPMGRRAPATASDATS